MKSHKTLLIVKYLVYALLLLLYYLMQSAAGLFSISGIQPLWVVPAAFAIAMMEGEFVGGIYGATAGLLLDSAVVPRMDGGGAVLFGFYGFFMTLFCVAVGLLVIYMIRCNWLSCVLFVLTGLLIQESLAFLFAYGMWGHTSVWKLYLYHSLPAVLYTAAVTPLPFWTARWVRRHFERHLQH